MIEFYYQIKARDNSEYGISSWAWPPVFSGKVSAENKKAAKVKVEEEYGREFPQRVLKKDLDEHHYLLRIVEIREDDDRTRGLFEPRVCMECKSLFKRIDLYNDHNETYKGGDFCGQSCKTIYQDRNRAVPVDVSGNGKPLIYQILNTRTKMSYIGKTTQVFTLRWYQHFFQGGSCKFHAAIRDSSLTDWEFKIIEEVFVPEGKDRDEFVAERERYWINHFNSIDGGYNSVSA